jgi:hypothetical protein
MPRAVVPASVGQVLRGRIVDGRILAKVIRAGTPSLHGGLRRRPGAADHRRGGVCEAVPGVAKTQEGRLWEW